MFRKRAFVGLLGCALTGLSLPADADPYYRHDDDEYREHHRWHDWEHDGHPYYRPNYRPYYRHYYYPYYRTREEYYRPHYGYRDHEDED